MHRALLLLPLAVMACGRAAPTSPSPSPTRSTLFAPQAGPAGSRPAAADTRAATAAPLNLTATSIGSTVALTWTAPPSGDPVTAYIIEAGSSSGAANLANFSTGNAATTFTASGIGNGTYYVRVRAVGSAGAGAASNEAVLVVGACTVPGAPGGLAIVSNRQGAITLAWSAASGAPSSYVIEAGSTPGSSNLATSDVGSSTILTTSGVGSGTYYVRVRARNSCGLGNPSNEVTLVVIAPRTTFGGGLHRVGIDIQPGRYYSDPGPGCTWQRRMDLGTGDDGIIANDSTSFDVLQWVVDVLVDDVAFTTSAECGVWGLSPPVGPQTTIGPGYWLVGPQVAPGFYGTAARNGCYWERVKDFSGSSSALITSGVVFAPGAIIAFIDPSDVGFTTNVECGTWRRVSAPPTQ